MEKLNRLIMLVLFVHQFFCAQSLINGAPIENCRSMRPQHDFQHDSNKPVMPQMEPPPFIFTVSANNKSSINPEYNVTISSQNGETFKGYFIQARSLTDSREVAVIGTFELMKDDKFSKVISCPGGTKNAVTHNFNSKKRFVTFTWRPPADFEGKFYFTATIVAEFRIYWVGVETPIFNITKQDD